MKAVVITQCAAGEQKTRVQEDPNITKAVARNTQEIHCGRYRRGCPSVSIRAFDMSHRVLRSARDWCSSPNRVSSKLCRSYAGHTSLKTPEKHYALG